MRTFQTALAASFVGYVLACHGFTAWECFAIGAAIGLLKGVSA